MLPQFNCIKENKTATVVITGEERSLTGSYEELDRADFPCYFFERRTHTSKENGSRNKYDAKATINGDIFPGKKLTGYVVVDDCKYIISAYTRCKNTDASVHHVKLELMR